LPSQYKVSMGKKRLTILHVIAGIDRSSGGTTTALKNILELEQLLGYNLDVLAIHSNDSDETIGKFATLHSSVASFPKRFSRSREANKWFHKNYKKYDLVHIHGIWSFLPLEIANAARRRHIPYIVSPHGSLDPFDLQKKSILKNILGPLFVAPILSASLGMLGTATIEAERFVTYGTSPRRFVLPLPVPTHSMKGNRKRFRERYSIEKDDLVLLFLSRINYKKGLNILLEALAKITKDYPNLRLIIAGADSGGYEMKVRSWVLKFNLTKQVFFPGFLKDQDKWDAFAGSDCFILPSMNENFGLAVIEALSAGLPVIISDNVYIWKDIVDAECSWICHYSSNSLFEVLKQFIHQKEERRRKSKHAPEAAGMFAPSVLAPHYRKFFEETIWRP